MIGDPTVADYGVEAILDDGFHASIARIIRGLKPTIDLTTHVALTAGPGLPRMSAAGMPAGGHARTKQPTGSCELAVVDGDGHWVQMMNTLQSGGIPGMVVEGFPMVGNHATFTGMNGFMDPKMVKGARARCVLGNTMVFQERDLSRLSCQGRGRPGPVDPAVLVILARMSVCSTRSASPSPAPAGASRRRAPRRTSRARAAGWRWSRRPRPSPRCRRPCPRPSISRSPGRS